MPDEDKTTRPPERALSPANLWAAAAIVAVFTGFCIYLVGQAASDIEPDQWARLLVIFSSFEALAFAAAGLLPGNQIGARSLRALREADQELGRAEAEADGATAKAKTIAEKTIAAAERLKSEGHEEEAGLTRLDPEAERLLDEAVMTARAALDLPARRR